MGLLTREQVFERFRQNARNSSHFVWLLAELRFFEASNGWIFAFTQQGDVTLLALEPLIPGAPREYTPEHAVDFDRAWTEFLTELKPKVTAWAGVYRPFLQLLKRQSFQSLQVGHEPWVKLNDCIPRGNSGRGVRNARNQALNAGYRVVEWKAEEIAADPAKKQTLLEILHDWQSHHSIHLGGFLNAVDPFARMEVRRYFVALSSTGRAEAFLIGTPVPGIRSYFLEDLVRRRNCANGIGALLTLEAMVALAESGGETASLGVVSVTSLQTHSADAAHALPGAVQFVLETLPRYLRKIYNFDGLETFRKRFKPHVWEEIHLAVCNQPGSGISDTRAWLKSLWALACAFKPRLQTNWRTLSYQLMTPLQRYPMTFLISGVSLALFAFVNRFGSLPQWAFNRFGFSASAPMTEWVQRSIASDYLYYDPTHFWVWGTAYFAMIFWAEKTHKRAFIVPLILLTSLLDDFVNYALIIAPFNFFQPTLFHSLVKTKDVGGSLGMVTLLGLQLCQVRKYREIFFALAAMTSVFVFLFQADQMQSLVVNLNHFLFICLGYMIGKLRFEHERKRMSKTSKCKPPQARSVLPASKSAPAKRKSVAEAVNS